MAGRSAPLAIAFWTVGACWAIAAVAYFCGVTSAFVVPLAILGIGMGIHEFAIRRKLT